MQLVYDVSPAINKYSLNLYLKLKTFVKFFLYNFAWLFGLKQMNKKIEQKFSDSIEKRNEIKYKDLNWVPMWIVNNSIMSIVQQILSVAILLLSLHIDKGFAIPPSRTTIPHKTITKNWRKIKAFLSLFV